MARAKVIHVKKARKSNKELGIKKGCEYWWWKFNYGPKEVSLTDPGVAYQERLTEHNGNMRDYENRKDKLENDWEGNIDEWNEEKETLESDIQEWQSELESRRDNIPEQLQESHMINEQIEEVENILSEVENLTEPDAED